MKITFFIMIFIIIINLSATIINIPSDYLTIQEGINESANGDTVLVQPGTYVENINYNGKNIYVASLFLTTQDTSYISQTIIDGNQNGSVVTFENEEDSTAVLSGFTTTSGAGNFLASVHNLGYFGGGIFCFSANPTLTNLTVINNSANRGGGISCLEASSPNMKNVTIDCNYATEYGGGIFCVDNSSPILENVTITNNSTTEWGGGIFCLYESNISLIYVSITGNSADGIGGGLLFRCSNPSLEDVIISGNSADSGGGIACLESNPTLFNVIITGNSTYLNYGGGIFCMDESDLSLVNVLITDNSAYRGGGIGGGENCILSLVNVTITSNSANEGGGIWFGNNCNSSLVNCIFWNDLPEEIYFYEGSNPCTMSISYSDIQDGETGIVTNNNATVNWLEGNINQNPLFSEIGDQPFSLTELSLCIDAGIPDTTGLNLSPIDIMGNLRIWDGDGNGSEIIDMGVYEFGAPSFVKIDKNIITQTPNNVLQQNYPNPFNPSTIIEFSIQNDSQIELSIYNIKGQKIKSLVNAEYINGSHSITWNGDNDFGKPVSSGVYYYKLIVNRKTEAVKKCLLLK